MLFKVFVCVEDLLCCATADDLSRIILHICCFQYIFVDIMYVVVYSCYEEKKIIMLMLLWKLQCILSVDYTNITSDQTYQKGAVLCVNEWAYDNMCHKWLKRNAVMLLSCITEASFYHTWIIFHLSRVNTIIHMVDIHKYI